MPRISAFYGIAIYMCYRDRTPPHFLAIYGEHEATVAIETAEVLDGKLPRRARTLVFDWAVADRADLARSWELACTGQPLPTIEGLESVREVLMILRIREAQVYGRYSLRLTFGNRTTRQVDASPLLDIRASSRFEAPRISRMRPWTRLAAPSSGLMVRTSPRKSFINERPRPRPDRQPDPAMQVAVSPIHGVAGQRRPNGRR